MMAALSRFERSPNALVAVSYGLSLTATASLALYIYKLALSRGSTRQVCAFKS